jgi:hypothetical protein
MKEDSVKEELVGLLMASDNLPDDDLTLEKIVERGHSFEKEGDSISFIITRHPGVGGRRSLGKGLGLSIFFSEKRKYIFNILSDEWEVKILDSELEFDSWLLAQEEIRSLEDGGIIPYDIGNETELESVMSNVEESLDNYFCEMLYDIPYDKCKEILKAVKKDIRDYLSKDI